MAKRQTRKKAPEVELKKNLGEPWCHVCKKPRPGGDETPLPYGWENHCVDDASYKRGYWLPLTCSDACRVKGGFCVRG